MYHTPFSGDSFRHTADASLSRSQGQLVYTNVRHLEYVLISRISYVRYLFSWNDYSRAIYIELCQIQKFVFSSTLAKHS